MNNWNTWSGSESDGSDSDNDSLNEIKKIIAESGKN